MKTKQISLMLIAMLAFVANTVTGQRVKVNAVNDDISYSLDLKAVASIFSEADDLEDFEYRINRYDASISNLDLNSDGSVDYLRVIETSENNTHVVVLQAVLDRDVYQDVATIVVERDRYRRSYVQIIGAPYIYGSNYIIEPVFYRTPRIVSWFWTPHYRRYYSPYYWGYYPRYYSFRRPVHIDVYLGHIHTCINYNHYYRYSNHWHSDHAYRVYSSITRNDYSVRYPDRHYSKRNTDYSNRYEMDRVKNSDYVRISESRTSGGYRNATPENRSSRSTTTQGNSGNGYRSSAPERTSENGYRSSSTNTESRTSTRSASSSDRSNTGRSEASSGNSEQSRSYRSSSATTQNRSSSGNSETRNNSRSSSQYSTPSHSESRSSQESVRSSSRGSDSNTSSSRGSSSSSRGSTSTSRAPESSSGRR